MHLANYPTQCCGFKMDFKVSVCLITELLINVVNAKFTFNENVHWSHSVIYHIKDIINILEALLVVFQRFNQLCPSQPHIVLKEWERFGLLW